MPTLNRKQAACMSPVTTTRLLRALGLAPTLGLIGSLVLPGTFAPAVAQSSAQQKIQPALLAEMNAFAAVPQVASVEQDAVVRERRPANAGPAVPPGQFSSLDVEETNASQ